VEKMDKNIKEIIKNMDLKFRNIDGKKLLLAISTDKQKNVLMTAFMSEESLEKSIETGYMHYYSTSRDKIWKKG
jgi:phosphoribosyl-AMP cyclohydrolase